METIYLTPANCKEYSDEEIQAKIAEKENEDSSFGEDFWDYIINEGEQKEFAKVEQSAQEAAAAAIQQAFIEKTKQLLEIAQAGYDKWAAKEYKPNKAKVIVGDELNGGELSIGFINRRRREKAMNAYMEDIIQYKKDLGII